MAVALAAAALWTLVLILAQVSLLRWARLRNRFMASLVAFLLVLAGNSLSVFGTLIGMAGPARTLLNVFYADLALLCAFVLYMPFYYTIAMSLSVQTMISLQATAEGNAPLTELHGRFASRSILDGRLESMVANSYLSRRGACFGLTRKGRLTARVFQWFKARWQLGPGG
jgi:hypothetical protein